MKKLIARYVMRKLWRMLYHTLEDERYGSLEVRYNILSLIHTALGGDSSWEPEDVKQKFEIILHRRAVPKQTKRRVMYACGFEDSPGEFGMFAGPSPFLQKMTNINVDDYIRERTRDLGFVPTSASSRAYILRFKGDQTTKIAEWDHDDESWITTENALPRESQRVAKQLPDPKGPYGPWFEIWSVGCNTGIRISAMDGPEAVRVFSNLVTKS